MVVDVPANNLTAASIRLSFTFLVGVVIVIVRGVHRVKRLFQIMNLPHCLKHSEWEVKELILLPRIDAGPGKQVQNKS
jgi:hypothetical protein